MKVLNKFFLNALIACFSLIACSNQGADVKRVFSKYDAITENLDLTGELSSSDYTIKAYKEISSNKQILIIPTVHTISSNEDYQFKEYFSRTSKEMLIGRILIERFIGSESFFAEYIGSLPSSFNDYYHMDEAHKSELHKRSINKHVFEDRKEAYESLIRKIPSSEIPNQLLNFVMYNWASSVISCYGIVAKKQYYPEVKKLFKLNGVEHKQELSASKEEILLIPGLNLIQNAKYKSVYGINFSSSLFAYKEHIYLNSDRLIEEGDYVYNNIQYLTNTKLFETCGTVIDDYFYEEVSVKVSNKDWTLLKLDLCKASDCLMIGAYGKPQSTNLVVNPVLTLKSSWDKRLLSICQIDQLDLSKNSEDDFKHYVKILKDHRRISNENYLKALTKCSNLLTAYLKSSSKTSIEEDIRDYSSLNQQDTKSKTLFRYVISQKRIINNHLLMFNNRIIKETRSALFGDIKSKYI